MREVFEWDIWVVVMGHARDIVPGNVRKCPAMLFWMMGMDGDV